MTTGGTRGRRAGHVVGPIQQRGGSDTTIKSTAVAATMAAALKVIVATAMTMTPSPSSLTFNT